MIGLVWLRKDLRLEDNPALCNAVQECQYVIPLFILDPAEEIGTASRWWLHHSLKSLAQSFEERGLRLILRSGDTLDELKEIVNTHKVERVYWNRRYTPSEIERDLKIKRTLSEKGLVVQSFCASLLFEPWDVKKGTVGPYKVYTPFWKSVKARKVPIVQTVPKITGNHILNVRSEDIESFGLLPSIPWDREFYDEWSPGESKGWRSFTTFADKVMLRYNETRDIPALGGTSRLSPHLHFGEVSVRKIWQECQGQLESCKTQAERTGCETFMKELVWREFAYHVIYHLPLTVNNPLRGEFARFPWRRSKEDLAIWKRGETGYPLVDAGMRQLWRTGWMHNRARMVVSSFLVKHLLLPWQSGAAWFMDTLLDADLANNTLGWQWVAGCGADAAPYFRIFNPVIQGEKFDPQGEYVRRWVPELSGLPQKWIHKPWESPASVLSKAGVVLGKTYPAPLVDHGEARARALRAYDEIKR
jgi:deoxyribodipyrimidine photo-lyase